MNMNRMKYSSDVKGNIENVVRLVFTGKKRK